MQFTCLLNVYIDIGTRYMKTCSVYHWNQNKNKAEDKWTCSKNIGRIENIQKMPNLI